MGLAGSPLQQNESDPQAIPTTNLRSIGDAEVAVVEVDDRSDKNLKIASQTGV